MANITTSFTHSELTSTQTHDLYCAAADSYATMMFNPSAGSPDDRKSMYSQPQNNVYKTGDKTSPISVILVSSGSRGNKLLFRYPFQRVAECPSSLTGRRHYIQGKLCLHFHIMTHEMDKLTNTALQCHVVKYSSLCHAKAAGSK